MLRAFCGTAWVAVLIAATPAAASSGGAGVPDAPAVKSTQCVASPTVRCGAAGVFRGGKIRLRGLGLRRTSRVVFLGRASRRDDVSAKPVAADNDHVDAIVPARANSGRVMVVDQLRRRAATVRVKVSAAPALDAAPGTGFYVGGKRRPTLTFSVASGGPVRVEVVDAAGEVITSYTHQATAGENTTSWNGLAGRSAAPTGTYTLRLATGSARAAANSAAFTLFDHLFPIRGKHNLGYTNTNQFGGGRGHQGIDMFASCGTRIAAARGGRVRYAGYQSAAGNYVVIDGAGTGNDYVYMHMRSTPIVRTGQRVFTGQKLGDVGDTGRATGCHLHFEMWSSPGWYEGGKPFPTVDLLRRWERYDR